MGMPIYAARQRRVAAGVQASVLPPEITQLSKLDEYLELPPVAWSMDYPIELEKYQESNEYLPIPPMPVSTRETPSTEQPMTSGTALSTGQPDNQASEGIPSDVEPRFADSSTSESICELPRTPQPEVSTGSVGKVDPSNRPWGQ